MARKSSENYVEFDVNKVRKAVEICGTPGVKLSQFVLGKSPEFISKCLSTGRMEIEALKKLCEFLSLKYDDVLIEMPEIKSTQKDDNLKTSLDLLLVAMTELTEHVKKQNEMLEEIVTQSKANNVKSNRFENALGQTVSNTIAIKDTLADIVKQGNERNSALNMTTGRLKDIYENTKPKKYYDTKGGKVG